MKNIPDERLVYLALKNIFIGGDAQIRRQKKIREVVQNNEHATEVGSLIQEYNLDNVCNVAKTLLELGIFESTVKAKIRFPEVFEISPAQSADRAASEEEAARSEADAIKSAADGQHVDVAARSNQDARSSEQLPSGKALVDDTLKQVARFQKRTLSSYGARVPSLYPVYLPYRTQHQLLSAIQTVLEEACYEFALTKMKEEVQKRGWDCPECIELNVWAQTFLSRQDLLPKDALERLGKPFSQLLDSISHLRHTAVHRIRVSATRLEQFLVDAESLARVLNDEVRLKSLVQIRRETQYTVSELKRNKDLLESKLSTRLQQISEEMSRLKQLEISVTDEMLRADKDYEVLAGDTLSSAVRSIIETRDTSIEIESRSGGEPSGTYVAFNEPSDSESEPDLDMTNIED